MKKIFSALLISFSIILYMNGLAYTDQIFTDDIILIGSECIGTDCVNGETFGYDALKFRENNLRILFDDTSSTASFPRNDWRIEINDTNNGGNNRFSIADASANRIALNIMANAKAYSLFIRNEDGSNNPRIGFGTSAPITTLHAKSGDSPTLRLEQGNTNGWTPQTWDIAGNETNFFVRDVTNASRIPFKIIPGAPTNSLCLSSNGNIGFGIKNALAGLHVVKAGLTGSDHLILLQNTVNSITTDTFKVDGNGNLTTSGTLSHGSSRAIKKNIADVNPNDILDRLLLLDVYTWQYKTDENAPHMGPMAEDFHAIFNLGTDDKHIAPGDMSGVAFAAIQALNEKIETRDLTIEVLEKENEEMADRLNRVEELVESLINTN